MRPGIFYNRCLKFKLNFAITICNNVKHNIPSSHKSLTLYMIGKSRQNNHIFLKFTNIKIILFYIYFILNIMEK